MNRRLFLLGGISCFSALALSKSALTTSLAHKKPLLFSACSKYKNQFFIAGMTINGNLDFLIAVPERVHDSCYVPSLNHIVFFGRSPSKSAYVVDLLNKTLFRKIETKPDRHFRGHGVVDFNGYVYTTENNALRHTGLIGIYDTKHHYQKIAEYPSYGIEPHQLLLMPDKKTLVVANGGLIKNPDNSRHTLNQSDFESSIAYIDIETGKLRGKFISPHHGNSLRHMTVSTDGEVFIGAQSHRNEIYPLIYRHNGSESLKPFDAEEYIWQSHQKYTADLSLGNDILVVTSPRGNVISFWDARSSRWLNQQQAPDASGIIALNNDQFIVSSGVGYLKRYYSKGELNYDTFHQLSWDNHLSLQAPQ